MRLFRSTAIILLAALLTACGQTAPADRLVEGRPFPPLTLTGLNRPDAELGSYHGRVVILNIWATWCGACLHELPALQALSEQLDPQHFAVVGLSVDSQRVVAMEFMRDRHIAFDNYIDAQQRIAKDILSVRVYPDTFVISPNGTLWHSISGERDWNRQSVVEALEAARRGDRSALSKL